MKTLLTGAEFWKYAPVPTFAAGELLIENGIITACGKPGTLSRDGASITDLGGALVAPGLIDLHTHGRTGGDFTSADQCLLRQMSRSYLAAGTTTVMPTLASAPMEHYVSAAERIAATSNTEKGARWLGLHLEGRYLNPEKRGAHARELLAPLDARELRFLHQQMCQPFAERHLPIPFRLTAALEEDTDGSFSAAAAACGIFLSLGHTTATYDEAMQALHNGVRTLTHLFNAMPPLHHRAGGAVAACFDAVAQTDGIYGELICDGLHIAPEMVRMAWRALGRDHTLLITDSMEGTACPDGEYAIAGERVFLKNGRAVTENGALAGSTLSLYEAVCHMSDMCRISLAEAITCATRNPARLLHLDRHFGSLEVGCTADMIVIDADTRALRSVWLNGEEAISC